MSGSDDRPGGLAWRKSSYSGGNGECVELAVNDQGEVWVRDSKNPAGPWLSFPAEAWRGFIGEVRCGGVAGS